MSNTESQKKGSSSEDKDQVNPKNATENESVIEHIEKPR